MTRPITRLKLRLAIPMECTCCMTVKSMIDFPNETPTGGCEHPVRTCQDCLNQWIHTSLQNSYTPNLHCPDCDQEILTTSDLGDQPLAQARCYEIYSRVVRGRTPGWRWCLEIGCSEGRVHQNATKQDQEEEQPRTRERKVTFSLPREEGSPSPSLGDVIRLPFEDMDLDESDIFACHGLACAGLACAVCDRPWHEGFTCTEYAWKNMRHLVEDALSLKVIAFLRAQGRIKGCPNCQCPIEKDGLGPDVFCTRCCRTFHWDEA